jgi:DNA-binding MarR family transcriptional regulator
MDNRPLMLVIKHTYKEWMNYMRKQALEAGIPDSYRMIVMYLARNPGASQKDLAEYCQRTPASISQTIREMQLTGYITKEISNEDKRFTRLYLTEKGQSSADRVRTKIHEADRIITSAITKEKEAELIEALNILTETIRKGL